LVSDYRFLHYPKNYQKSLYYINKAIGIDGENSLYWRRYANINQYLNFFEEAEEGYRKAFENGDIELDNFLCWSDVLYVLGEVSAAFEILNQAKDLYPNESEIQYRMVVCILILTKNSMLLKR